MDLPASRSSEEPFASCNCRASHVCKACSNAVCGHDEYIGGHGLPREADSKSYRILQDSKYGRYMVASRDLKAGEIVFRERALVVGPQPGRPPVCLACSSTFKAKHPYRCPLCNFPFCQESCAQDAVHKEECAVLARIRDKITITDLTKPHPVYECITPLRGILLKNNKPAQYQIFANLQHHNEQRQGTDSWRVSQVNVVNFLRIACGLIDQFTEEEIHSACGIMEINGFEIRPTSGAHCSVGIFPTAAMMAHHCISNVCHVIGTGNEMAVRASVPIREGQPIYLNYADSLEGTKDRRALLRCSKFFECDCSRCSDPTECSTYLSALKCQKCPDGKVLPVNPLDEFRTDWKCDMCGESITAVNVERVLYQLKQEFDMIGSNDVEKFEQFIKRYSSLLHPNHYLFTRARHSLSQLYGRDERFLLYTLTPDQLERKVEVCRQFLVVVDIVQPGLSRLRGVTLYEMHGPLLLLARRRHETGQISFDQFNDHIQNIGKMLTELTELLALEDPNSREGGMLSAAIQALEQIQSWTA